ncbi:MAG TPA: methylated-DNA--[protein]-cysteine S-methyltransferase [Thermoanaerobaculia bacterium]|nr:methylated-DNA--[protein]-cysteine S-methyltransferase [Thermoanaerobaculia bacterium]
MKRYELIWSVVRKVPRGRVATYGQIAELADLEGHARQVGYALHNLPAKSNVPWHRVVNAKGEISARTGGDSHELQRLLLDAEGVEFDLRGRVDLRAFRWKRVGASVSESQSRRVSEERPRKLRSGAKRRL